MVSLAGAVYLGRKASKPEMLSMLTSGKNRSVGGVETSGVGAGVGILGLGGHWELLCAVLGGVGWLSAGAAGLSWVGAGGLLVGPQLFPLPGLR